MRKKGNTLIVATLFVVFLVIICLVVNPSETSNHSSHTNITTENQILREKQEDIQSKIDIDNAKKAKKYLESIKFYKNMNSNNIRFWGATVDEDRLILGFKLSANMVDQVKIWQEKNFDDAYIPWIKDRCPHDYDTTEAKVWKIIEKSKVEVDLFNFAGESVGVGYCNG